MQDPTNNQINKRLNRMDTDIEVLQAAVRELRLVVGWAGVATPAVPAPTTPLPGPQEPAAPEWDRTPNSPSYPPEPLPLVPPPPPYPPMPLVVGPTFVVEPGAQLEAATQTEQAAQPPAFRPNFDFLRSTEFWLNKVGIGLLLLGLAFLFKYSIDRGLITPPLRVAFGLGMGSVLLALGLAFHAERRHFSQVLLGGSIATYYITGFAAYQLYHLPFVTYEMAFGYMVAITLLAFVLSVRQDEVMLALIGTLGGLGTPFVLPTDNRNLPALVMYTCVLLAGASAIYFYKGWRSLLWISYIGGWAVFAVGYMGTFWANSPTESDRWAIQGAALFSALAFWALPVLREALRADDPARWPRPDLGRLGDLGNAAETHVYLLVISVPLLTLGASAAAWGDIVRHQTWGLAALAAAALYFRVFRGLRRHLPALAYTHTMMAVLLLTLGLFEIFAGEQNMLLFSLAVEATALHLVSARLRDRGTLVYAHCIFAWLALYMAQRFLWVTPVFNADSLTNLAVIALAITSSFAMVSRNVTILYRNVAYLAFGIWLWDQLSPLTGRAWFGYVNEGQAYVMLAWGACAVLLNTLYRRLRGRFTIYDSVAPALAFFGGAAALFATRLLFGHGGELAFLNFNTLLDAALIVLAVGCAYELRPSRVAYVYKMAAHVGVLALLWRELGWLPDGSSYVIVAWAAYAALWQYIARRTEDRVTMLAAHIPFVLIALAFITRVVTGREGAVAFFNIKGMADLVVILLALYVATLVQERRVALAYRLGAHVAFLALLWRELAPIPHDGNAFVTISWGIYALVLVVAGAYMSVYRGRDRTMLYVGVVTLFAVVGKLLLIDLVMLDQVWRFLLFLGFGALFLALSYYFQNLLRPARSG